MPVDCIFCKIVSNEARANVVYRDEQVTAFRDKHPVAPTHILIVPNRHIDSVGTLEQGDEPLVGHIFSVARKLAEQEGISRGEYRIITNTGPDGGQSVFHLHVHLIGVDTPYLRTEQVPLRDGVRLPFAEAYLPRRTRSFGRVHLPRRAVPGGALPQSLP